jgi:hypothetical protein
LSDAEAFELFHAAYNDAILVQVNKHEILTSSNDTQLQMLIFDIIAIASLSNETHYGTILAEMQHTYANLVELVKLKPVVSFTKPYLTCDDILDVY